MIQNLFLNSLCRNEAQVDDNELKFYDLSALIQFTSDAFSIPVTSAKPSFSFRQFEKEIRRIAIILFVNVRDYRQNEKQSHKLSPQTVLLLSEPSAYSFMVILSCLCLGWTVVPVDPGELLLQSAANAQTALNVSSSFTAIPTQPMVKNNCVEGIEAVDLCRKEVFIKMIQETRPTVFIGSSSAFKNGTKASRLWDILSPTDRLLSLPTAQRIGKKIHSAAVRLASSSSSKLSPPELFSATGVLDGIAWLTIESLSREVAKMPAWRYAPDLVAEEDALRMPEEIFECPFSSAEVSDAEQRDSLLEKLFQQCCCRQLNSDCRAFVLPSFGTWMPSGSVSLQSISYEQLFESVNLYISNVLLVGALNETRTTTSKCDKYSDGIPTGTAADHNEQEQINYDVSGIIEFSVHKSKYTQNESVRNPEIVNQVFKFGRPRILLSENIQDLNNLVCWLSSAVTFCPVVSSCLYLHPEILHASYYHAELIYRRINWEQNWMSVLQTSEVSICQLSLNCLLNIKPQLFKYSSKINNIYFSQSNNNVYYNNHQSKQNSINSSLVSSSIPHPSLHLLNFISCIQIDATECSPLIFKLISQAVNDLHDFSPHISLNTFCLYACLPPSLPWTGSRLPEENSAQISVYPNTSPELPVNRSLIEIKRSTMLQGLSDATAVNFNALAGKKLDCSNSGFILSDLNEPSFLQSPRWLSPSDSDSSIFATVGILPSSLSLSPTNILRTFLPSGPSATSPNTRATSAGGTPDSKSSVLPNSTQLAVRCYIPTASDLVIGVCNDQMFVIGRTSDFLFCSLEIDDDGYSTNQNSFSLENVRRPSSSKSGRLRIPRLSISIAERKVTSKLQIINAKFVSELFIHHQLMQQFRFLDFNCYLVTQDCLRVTFGLWPVSDCSRSHPSSRARRAKRFFQTHLMSKDTSSPNPQTIDMAVAVSKVFASAASVCRMMFRSLSLELECMFLPEPSDISILPFQTILKHLNSNNIDIHGSNIDEDKAEVVGLEIKRLLQSVSCSLSLSQAADRLSSDAPVWQLSISQSNRWTARQFPPSVLPSPSSRVPLSLLNFSAQSSSCSPTTMTASSTMAVVKALLTHSHVFKIAALIGFFVTYAGPRTSDQFVRDENLLNIKNSLVSDLKFCFPEFERTMEQPSQTTEDNDRSSDFFSSLGSQIRLKDLQLGHHELVSILRSLNPMPSPNLVSVLMQVPLSDLAEYRYCIPADILSAASLQQDNKSGDMELAVVLPHESLPHSMTRKNGRLANNPFGVSTDNVSKYSQLVSEIIDKNEQTMQTVKIEARKQRQSLWVKILKSESISLSENNYFLSSDFRSSLSFVLFNRLACLSPSLALSRIVFRNNLPSQQIGNSHNYLNSKNIFSVSKPPASANLFTSPSVCLVVLGLDMLADKLLPTTSSETRRLLSMSHPCDRMLLSSDCVRCLQKLADAIGEYVLQLAVQTGQVMKCPVANWLSEPMAERTGQSAFNAEVRIIHTPSTSYVIHRLRELIRFKVFAITQLTPFSPKISLSITSVFSSPSSTAAASSTPGSSLYLPRVVYEAVQRSASAVLCCLPVVQWGCETISSYLSQSTSSRGLQLGSLPYLPSTVPQLSEQLLIDYLISVNHLADGKPLRLIVPFSIFSSQVQRFMILLAQTSANTHVSLWASGSPIPSCPFLLSRMKNLLKIQSNHSLSNVLLESLQPAGQSPLEKYLTSICFAHGHCPRRAVTSCVGQSSFFDPISNFAAGIEVGRMPNELDWHGILFLKGLKKTLTDEVMCIRYTEEKEMIYDDNDDVVLNLLLSFGLSQPSRKDGDKILSSSSENELSSASFSNLNKEDGVFQESISGCLGNILCVRLEDRRALSVWLADRVKKLENKRKDKYVCHMHSLVRDLQLAFLMESAIDEGEKGSISINNKNEKYKRYSTNETWTTTQQAHFDVSISRSLALASYKANATKNSSMTQMRQASSAATNIAHLFFVFSIDETVSDLTKHLLCLGGGLRTCRLSSCPKQVDENGHKHSPDDLSHIITSEEDIFNALGFDVPLLCLLKRYEQKNHQTLRLETKTLLSTLFGLDNDWTSSCEVPDHPDMLNSFSVFQKLDGNQNSDENSEFSKVYCSLMEDFICTLITATDSSLECESSDFCSIDWKQFGNEELMASNSLSLKTSPRQAQRRPPVAVFSSCLHIYFFRQFVQYISTKRPNWTIKVITPKNDCRASVMNRVLSHLANNGVMDLERILFETSIAFRITKQIIRSLDDIVKNPPLNIGAPFIVHGKLLVRLPVKTIKSLAADLRLPSSSLSELESRYKQDSIRLVAMRWSTEKVRIRKSVNFALSALVLSLSKTSDNGTEDNETKMKQKLKEKVWGSEERQQVAVLKRMVSEYRVGTTRYRIRNYSRKLISFQSQVSVSQEVISLDSQYKEILEWDRSMKKFD